MFDALIPQVIEFAVNYATSKPAQAIDLVLFKTPIKNYIFKTLTEEQMLFLSKETDKDPTSLLRYFQSKEGKEKVRELFDAYMKFTN